MKSIFIRKKTVDDLANYDNDSLTVTYLEDANEEAYQSSIQANGSSFNLEALFNHSRAKFLKLVSGNSEIQERLKEHHRIELSKLDSERKKYTAISELKEEEVQEIKSTIRSFRRKILDARIDPVQFGLSVAKSLSPIFYFGLAIELFVTAYLCVFYSSTAYSTFFREFGTDTSVIEAMFDSNSIAHAWNQGFVAISVVLLFPFVFLALGYLLHVFHKKWMKVIPLLSVAMIFDIILAYKIDQNIYDVNKTLMTADFNFNIALQSFSFWLIIFSGFIIYLVWGFLFNYLANEYEKSDEFRTFKRNMNQHIKDKEIDIKNLSTDIRDYRQTKLPSINAEIEIKNTILEEQYIEPKNAWDKIHTDIYSGWLRGIDTIARERGLTTQTSEDMKQGCKSVSESMKNTY
jgi:hypothetical protein